MQKPLQDWVRHRMPHLLAASSIDAHSYDRIAHEFHKRNNMLPPVSSPSESQERQDNQRYNLILLLAAVGLSLLASLLGLAFLDDKEEEDAVPLATRQLRILRRRATGAQKAVATRFDLLARSDGAIEVHPERRSTRFRKLRGADWYDPGQGDEYCSRLGRPAAVVPPGLPGSSKRAAWELSASGSAIGSGAGAGGAGGGGR